MPTEVPLPSGDVICSEHGFQISGDNTCEICYRERLEKHGPGLIEQMTRAIKNDFEELEKEKDLL